MWQGRWTRSRDADELQPQSSTAAVAQAFTTPYVTRMHMALSWNHVPVKAVIRCISSRGHQLFPDGCGHRASGKNSSLKVINLAASQTSRCGLARSRSLPTTRVLVAF
ncbi:hypothetical protein OE88DRAFT_792064 [Heliocybe sulcata]|uniref:Uncharacterized protein n=1 Tax=Heliocybe sulcata TaxID=5364 RepID=A0A5C3MSA4_9AGAM|nr:hypothetical protein OE88DRAFT_792064 [Heliocybe sulcata]